MSEQDNVNEIKKNSFAERFARQSSGNFKDSIISQKGNSAETLKPNNIQQKIMEQHQEAEKRQENLASVDPQKKAQSELIYLVKGVDDGRNAWYYVLVEKLKVQLFLKALNDDIIHLENYGKILHSAYGDEPPAEVTDLLKAEYGIE